MKKTKMAAAVLLVLLLLTACSSKQDKIQDTVSVSESAEYFGTVITITLYDDDEKKLNTSIEKAFAECGRLENIFSAKLQDSELSRLNRTAFNSPVKVSEELFLVLEEALFYNRLSDGSFDISIGKLINLWGIGTENERVPSDEELEPLVNQKGCEDIVLDQENGTVMYTSEMVEIDLGAIAKGYAADRIKQFLAENEGIGSGILNFGGNVLTIGEKTDGSAWKIGITDPLQSGKVYGAVSVKDACVITSGNYERYFVENGIKYHHILDPTTGFPAEQGIISATIIGSSSTECDAMSTACYILGADRALELIESVSDVECVLIDEAGMCYCSSGIEKYGFYQIKEAD